MSFLPSHNNWMSSTTHTKRKSTTKVEIDRFHLTNLDPASNIVIIGKKNTGKSWLVRDLMYHFRKFPVGVVISPTEKTSPFFSSFFPQTMLQECWDPDYIRRLYESQEKRLINKEHHLTDQDRIALIMDDCLADAHLWKRDKYIRKLFMNGRHAYFLFILTMQFVLGIPPDLRTNIDYTFIFRENILKERKKIWENYAGVIPTFTLFNSLMDKCTQKHMCLVICNNGTSNELSQNVFWYKAQMHAPFRFGSPQLWDWDAKNKKSQEDDDEEEDKAESNAGLTRCEKDYRNLTVVMKGEH